MKVRTKFEEDSATFVEATAERGSAISTSPNLETQVEAQEVIIIKDDEGEAENLDRNNK